MQDVAEWCGIMFEMSNLPPNTEGVLPYFDSVDYSQMKKGEIKEITNAIEDHQPVTINDAARFVHTDLGRFAQFNALKKLGIFGGLFGLAIATDVIHDDLALTGEVPHLHEFSPMTDIFFQSAYDRLVPFGETAVDSAYLGDHIPLMIASTAVLYTAYATAKEAGELFYSKGMRKRSEQAQNNAIDRLHAGTFDWSIKPGSTAAFVSSGDSFAKILADTKPGDIIQLANQPVNGQWVHLADDASNEDLLRAYERADLTNAGELVFLPVKEDMAYLPGPDDFEISVGKMVHHIEVADEIYGAKPVIIIGSKDQAAYYVESHHSQDYSEPTVATIEEKMERLADKRGQSILVLDQTEIINNRIVEIADGEPISYFAVQDAMDTYRERFYKSLRGHEKGSPINGPGVRVLYGLKDYTTVNEALPYTGDLHDETHGKKDLAILIDPTEAPKLMRRGLQEDQILVVADEVLKVAAPYLSGDSS